MLVTIVSALVFTEIKDGAVKLLSDRARALWDTWELRILILFSFAFQIVLVMFGYRRRRSATSWVSLFVWAAYLLADWVAAVTLSNLLRTVKNLKLRQAPPYTTSTTTLMNMVVDSKLNVTTLSLRAFWAPFLLLHIGGPDTITAFALEDNELWLRRLVGSVVQVVLAAYLFITYFSPPRTDPDDPLLYVAIPIFVAGTIKCLDRCISLRSASRKQWRTTLLSAPPSEEKKKERAPPGRDVEKERQPSPPDPFNYDHIFMPAKYLHHAYMQFHVLKFLYGEVKFKISNDLFPYFTASTYTVMGYEDAFKMVVSEIGFLYDMLYTKIPIMQSLLGRILRILCFFCSISALVAFCVVINRKAPYSALLKHSDVDLIITYLLLVGSVMLETYWIFYHIFSDWTLIWLSRDNKKSLFISFYNAISILMSFRCIVGLKSTRCMVRRESITCSLSRDELSESTNLRITQQNIFQLSRHAARAKRFGCVEQFLRFHGVFGQFFFSTSARVKDDLKESIHDYLHDLYLWYGGFGFDPETQKDILEMRGQIIFGEDFKSSTTDLEFDHSILLWHVATELLYHRDASTTGGEKRKISKWLSDYMFHLLVCLPSMMPNGISDLRIKHTCEDLVQVFDDLPISAKKKITSMKDDEQEAWKKLSDQCNAERPTTGGNKSVLRKGIELERELLYKQDKWKMICAVWIEMLAYAAGHCEWKQHARQLGRGVELLTCVSLLMAHLGFTPQIQCAEMEELRPPQEQLPDAAENLQRFLLYCLV